MLYSSCSLQPLVYSIDLALIILLGGNSFPFSAPSSHDALAFLRITNMHESQPNDSFPPFGPLLPASIRNAPPYTLQTLPFPFSLFFLHTTTSVRPEDFSSSLRCHYLWVDKVLPPTHVLLVSAFVTEGALMRQDVDHSERSEERSITV